MSPRELQAPARPLARPWRNGAARRSRGWGQRAALLTSYDSSLDTTTSVTPIGTGRYRRAAGTSLGVLPRSSLLSFRERNCESGNSPFYDIIVERGKTQYNASRIGSTQQEPIKRHGFDPLRHRR
jgi:hypothetical protein